MNGLSTAQQALLLYSAQGRPGTNGLKGEKGEPGDASLGFSMRVSVLKWQMGGLEDQGTRMARSGPLRSPSRLFEMADDVARHVCPDYTCINTQCACGHTHNYTHISACSYTQERETWGLRAYLLWIHPHRVVSFKISTAFDLRDFVSWHLLPFYWSQPLRNSGAPPAWLCPALTPASHLLCPEQR